MVYTDLQWIIAIAIGWIALIGPGNIEGKYFPAASEMEILVSFPTDKINKPPQGNSVFKRSGNHSAIWVRVARLRHPECSIRYLEIWKVGPDGNDVPVLYDWGPPTTRGEGYFIAGPWILRAPIKDLPFLEVDALHQCGLFGTDFPWLTRTRLITPELKVPELDAFELSMLVRPLPVKQR